MSKTNEEFLRDDQARADRIIIDLRARVVVLEAHLRELVKRGEGCILANDWPKPEGSCGGCHWCRALAVLDQRGEGNRDE